MSNPLMPKATAVWLIDNTGLTFAQIAKFCGMHERQVKGIADGDVASGITGLSPVQSGQLTLDEIKRCEADPSADLTLYVRKDLPDVRRRAKGPRYTPMNKRNEKPNAIAWLVKNHPGLSDAAIGRLLATTKDTIRAIRDRTHWNIGNIKPENPVLSGQCTQRDLDAELKKVRSPNEDVSAIDAAELANSEGETPEDGAGEANPFAAALAAYASAARQKITADTPQSHSGHEENSEESDSDGNENER